MDFDNPDILLEDAIDLIMQNRKVCAYGTQIMRTADCNLLSEKPSGFFRQSP